MTVRPASVAFTGSFGHEYERQVSKAKAAAFLGDRPLPSMGRQLAVAVGGNASLGSWRSRLVLSNVSGTFYLRSHNCRCTEWKRTFGLDGLEPDVKAIEQILASAPAADSEFSQSLRTSIILP